MHISNESLLVILVVGLVAGWLAGQIVRGTGFGLIGDLIIGIIGAFIGDWLLPRIGIHLGTGIVSAIINATIGAILNAKAEVAVRRGRQAMETFVSRATSSSGSPRNSRATIAILR